MADPTPGRATGAPGALEGMKARRSYRRERKVGLRVGPGSGPDGIPAGFDGLARWIRDDHGAMAGPGEDEA